MGTSVSCSRWGGPSLPVPAGAFGPGGLGSGCGGRGPCWVFYVVSFMVQNNPKTTPKTQYPIDPLN